MRVSNEQIRRQLGFGLMLPQKSQQASPQQAPQKVQLPSVAVPQTPPKH